MQELLLKSWSFILSSLLHKLLRIPKDAHDNFWGVPSSFLRVKESQRRNILRPGKPWLYIQYATREGLGATAHLEPSVLAHIYYWKHKSTSPTTSHSLSVWIIIIWYVDLVTQMIPHVIKLLSLDCTVCYIYYVTFEQQVNRCIPKALCLRVSNVKRITHMHQL